MNCLLAVDGRALEHQDTWPIIGSYGPVSADFIWQSHSQKRNNRVAVIIIISRNVRRNYSAVFSSSLAPISVCSGKSQQKDCRDHSFSSRSLMFINSLLQYSSPSAKIENHTHTGRLYRHSSKL